MWRVFPDRITNVEMQFLPNRTYISTVKFSVVMICFEKWIVEYCGECSVDGDDCDGCDCDGDSGIGDYSSVACCMASK